MKKNPLIELKTKLDFDCLNPNQMKEAVDYWISEIQAEVKRIHQQTERELSWENTIQNLLNLFNHLNKVFSVASHFNMVMDSSEIREVFEYAMIEVQKLSDAIDQDKQIYQHFLSLYQNDENLNPAQRRYLDLEIKKYQKQGVHLEEEKRKRLQQINQSLAKLSLKFEQNILDDCNQFSLLIKNRSELNGLSDGIILSFESEAKKQNKKGFLISLSQPNVIAILETAENRDLREKIHRAWSTRAKMGDFDNHPNINEILKLRNEKATMLGFDDYCHYVLSDRMAKNYHSVNDLLQSIGTKAKKKADMEFKALDEFAKSNLGINGIKAHDISFVSQKLKEKTFGFNDEMLRSYFPINKVLTGLFEIANQLYGINFVEVDYPTWNQKVKSFELFQDDDLIGILYVDLYARSTKRSGAWMSDYQSLMDKQYHQQSQIPVAFINMNFMDEADGKSYLSFEDVLTLFHETGHSLHHLLTKVGLTPIAGINSVQWDAVELPSQLMENFCYNWHYLQKMSEHQETKKPISYELFSQMIAAKNQFSGLFLIRQLIFGLFDLNIHHQENYQDWKAILDGIKKEWMVFESPEYESHATSFSHIFAGGYASGYYSYLWADILSSDVYGAFVEKSEVADWSENNNHQTQASLDKSYFAKTANKDNGREFLNHFLSQGAIKDASDLFYDFRGREPRVDYLFESYGVN